VKRVGITAGGGLAAAVAAVVVSSCCALPTALVFMGVSTGLVGLLGPLHSLRPIILGVAAILLVAGWIVAIRRRAAGAYAVLALGTLLLTASFFWQVWDPVLQRLAFRTLNS
jgi:mercuric ion transport protein